MFALLIPSRPLLSAQQLSETHYAFHIPLSSGTFSHLALFLLPTSNFPADAGATVWIQIPGSNNNEFKLLGGLGPGKPSAIYRIKHPLTENGVKVDSEGDVTIDDEYASIDSIVNGQQQNVGGSTAGAQQQQQNGEIIVGVQIDSALRVAEQLNTLKSPSEPLSASGAGAVVKFPLSSANLGGFGGRRGVQSIAMGGTTAGGITSVSGPVDTKILAQRIIANAFNFLSSFGSDVIPLKAFQEWWKKFEKKVEQDPTFLEREQG